MITATGYEALRQDVGLVDRSDRGKVMLAGREAAEFLQGQVTNDVESLRPGGGCYAALLTHKGKLRADLRILRGDGWLWLDTEAIGVRPLLHTIETYSLGRDVHWEDVTEERVILSLIGPKARERLDAAPAEEEHTFVEGRHGVYVATDLGVDVICERAAAAEVRDSLGVEAVSAEAAECRRIESGRPRLGVDMDAETIPEEAGLNERAVSFTKGCYVGQETVARLHYKGKPNRHLRGIRLAAPATTGEPVFLGEKEVGKLGSVCNSPAFGPIALAVVRREASPGDVVQVGDDGNTGRLVHVPFDSP